MTGDKAERADVVLLAAALAVLLAGIVAFYAYPEVSPLLRMGGAIACAGVAVGLAWRTAIGRQAWGFLHEAQLEVRKVVWPSRHQTLQMTLFVFVIVVLVAIILWVLDWFLGALVKWMLA